MARTNSPKIEPPGHDSRQKLSSTMPRTKEDAHTEVLSLDSSRTPKPRSGRVRACNSMKSLVGPPGFEPGTRAGSEGHPAVTR
jgi:hypothetical protein